MTKDEWGELCSYWHENRLWNHPDLKPAAEAWHQYENLLLQADYPCDTCGACKGPNGKSRIEGEPIPRSELPFGLTIWEFLEKLGVIPTKKVG